MFRFPLFFLSTYGFLSPQIHFYVHVLGFLYLAVSITVYHHHNFTLFDFTKIHFPFYFLYIFYVCSSNLFLVSSSTYLFFVFSRQPLLLYFCYFILHQPFALCFLFCILIIIDFVIFTVHPVSLSSSDPQITFYLFLYLTLFLFLLFPSLHIYSLPE